MQQQDKEIGTKEAFRYFVENIYPDIVKPSGSLRVAVHRYRNQGSISEEKMTEILKGNGFEPARTRKVEVVLSWHLPS